MRLPQEPANGVDVHVVPRGENDARDDWEPGPSSEWAMRSCDGAIAPLLRGFVTEADLPQAEKEWPGLQEFLEHIPADERPSTFLDLVWRFECFLGRTRSV
jgi:hypothetical protein